MIGMSFDPAFFLTELRVAFTYIPIVALLSVVPLLCGLALGTLLAFFRIYQVRFWARFAQGYVVVMRSIPMLLQMFLFYYLVRGVYQLFGWNLAAIDKVVVVLIAFSFNAAGFLSEGVRAALKSVDQGQYEAGYSVGMTRLQTMRHVVSSQCLPVAVPVTGSAFIGLIKGSSAAYLMGIIEMIQGTSMQTAGNYRYLEAYCAVALIYWALTVLVEQLTRRIENQVSLKIKAGVVL